MMKKVLCLLTACVIFTTVIKAQEESAPEERGFNRNRVFLGTSLNLGLSNRYFNIGLNPEIGYSLNNWMDVGLAFNLNHFSQGASDYDNTKYSNFNYGGGAFIRIWPLPFLHVQIQPEQNWINSTRTNTATNETFKYKLNASSLLAGIGYGSREIGSRFSHFTIMIDLNQAFSSPYRDQFGDPQPVFRGGFGVYLNAKKK